MFILLLLGMLMPPKRLTAETEAESIAPANRASGSYVIVGFLEFRRLPGLLLSGMFFADIDCSHYILKCIMFLSHCKYSFLGAKVQ
jgi:hypothetical protein